jgi:hypothetical protein
MEWFKFYGQDWLTDLKIMRMASEDKLCFITLLCLANSSDNPGVVKNCNEWSIIRLTQLYDDPLNDDNEARRAAGFLQRLNDNGMITIDNNGDVIINNFLKRQGQSLTGYERVKKYREKQREVAKNSKKEVKIRRNVINDNANDNATDNKMITIEESRVEESRKELNTNTLSLNATGETKFNFKSKMQEMQTSPRPIDRIIALYWDYKGIEFENEKQYQAGFNRELRPASTLAGYANDKIEGVMVWLNDSANCDFNWTLETVHKIIDVPILKPFVKKAKQESQSRY